VPDQGKPHVAFVRELLSLASGKDQNGDELLTAQDLSEYLAKRRVDSRASNPGYSLSRFHKVFGSAKYVCLFFFLRIVQRVDKNPP